MRILIAEDSLTQRRMLRVTLEQAGHRVVEATDGNMAWTLLRKHNLTMVLTDWMMPGLSGLELTQKIRSANLPQYVYIVLLTARHTGVDVVSGLKAGADDYLVKPFDAEELLARIAVGERILSLEAELRTTHDQLRVQASRDPLTNLLNRRAFYDAASAEFDRAQRKDQPLSLVMLDIDYFKRVNDKYGHPVGDKVLVMIARVLDRSRRSYDQVGRFGGEEFAVLLPDTKLKTAALVAERIRQEIAQASLPLGNDQVLTVQASLGVAAVRFDGHDSLADLIQRVDAALYSAKQRGRNQVQLSDDERMSTDSEGVYSGQAVLVELEEDPLDQLVTAQLDNLSNALPELIAATDLVRLFTEHAPVAVAVLDTNLCYVLMSRRWMEDYHLEARDFVGVQHLELLPNLPQHWPMTLEQALAGETLASNEDELFIRPDGQSDWIAWEVAPWYREQDGIGGVVLFSEIVTKRRQVEQALREAEATIAATNRVRDEFLANINHEVRTPLTALIGMADLLFNTSLTEEQREFAETIHTSGNALLEMMNAILDFAELVAGSMMLNEQPFALSALLDDLFEQFAIAANAKGLKLTTHIHPSVPAGVVGDRQRLHQMISNVLSNAIKFTEEGEVVVMVDTSLVELRFVKLKVAIQDTGIGIDPQIKNMLFEAFRQVDSSNTRKYEGLGLGLTISKQLAELMGGDIWFEDGVASGSVFSITAMLQVQQVASEWQEWGVQAGGLKGRRVLLVDDTVTERIRLSEDLRLQGIEVRFVNTLIEAQLLLSEGGIFDTVIVSIDETEVHNDAVARRLRILPAQKYLPLVLLVSASAVESRLTGELLPLTRLLRKPVTPVQLCRTIHELLVEAAATQPAYVTARPAEPQMERLTEGAHILIADENAVNRMILLRQLDQLGYAADVVLNGRDVLERLQRQRYALILLDMQMPEIDGIATTHEIRRRWPREQQPRIIALSTYSASNERERCIQEGMDDYLSKPIALETLEALLERYLVAPQTEVLVEPESILPEMTMMREDVVLDKTVLQRYGVFFGADGDQEIEQLVDAFLYNASEVLADMRTVLEAADYVQLGSLAHSLKGACKSIGALEAAALCQRIEEQADEHRPDTVLTAATVQLLQEAIERVRVALTELVSPDATH